MENNRLFSVTIYTQVERKTAKAGRIQKGQQINHLVVKAESNAHADYKARAYVQARIDDPEVMPTWFGNGRRDAISAVIGEVFVAEVDDDVVEV